MSDEITVRDVKSKELPACESLYVSVMGLRPDDGSINPRLLTALQANSGTVLGAYAGAELIGFAYGFLGRKGTDAPHARLYHYSQLAVVSPQWQGKGVGRRLKYAQRDRCLAEGITLMRWAFDPVKTRNGHFNLNVLGARIVQFIPSMYGEAGFGSDAGDRTDRFIVEWDLLASASGEAGTGATVPPQALPGAIWESRPGSGASRHGADELVVAVPAHWERYRADRGARAAEVMRDSLRDQFTKALDSGWVGVACDVLDPETAVYRFIPGDQAPRVPPGETKAEECR